ncbi:MAG: hypothetical protein NVS2B12_23490 [Ktedonobacteraceae bacterium]
MRHSSPGNPGNPGKQIQQEMVASNIASETRQDAVYAHVDPYTLEIIQQIFPAPNKGLEFVAGILRFAQIAQNVLPGLEDLGEHIAIINVRTIRILAKSIGWGYDTTHKYVVTFCALGLLRRSTSKQGKERMLVFPLKRYVLPTSLRPLDELIADSRPKVQQFARQVTARLLHMYPGLSTLSSSTDIVTSKKNNKPGTQSRVAIYQSLSDLMESEGIDARTSRHISKRIITEILSQFEIPAASQAQEQTHRHIATGTTGAIDMQPPRTQALPAPASTPYEPQYHQSGLTNQQPEHPHYQPESTRYPAKYPAYQQESTQRSTEYPQQRIESTGYSTKYPAYQQKSTAYPSESTVQHTGSTGYSPTHPQKSTHDGQQGRLSGAGVYPQGRRAEKRVPARSRPVRFEISPTITLEQPQVDWSKLSAPTQGSHNTHNDPYTSRSHQASFEQTAGLYSTRDTSATAMSSQEILACYQNVLDDNPVDWEADGLPSEFIERLYQELHAVYTNFSQRRLIGSPQGFFLKTLERRFIAKLANEYRLDFTSVHNLIMYRTQREHFILNEPAVSQPAPQDQHSAAQHASSAPGNAYQQPATPYPPQYQQLVDRQGSEYQYPVDQRGSEYQQLVDSRSVESTQPPAREDSKQQKRRQPVDPNAQQPALASNAQTHAQEQTEPPPSIAEIIERSILEDGKALLRIPLQLDTNKYSPEFLHVYVTSNINKLFNKIYTDVTIRNDAKMFFAEVFDNKRSALAKNWYNKLFTKCSSAESLQAGFIETILDLHARGNKSIQNPGGLFNKKCAECEQAISDSAREHINTYGELPYEKFVLEIARYAQGEFKKQY